MGMKPRPKTLQNNLDAAIERTKREHAKKAEAIYISAFDEHLKHEVHQAARRAAEKYARELIKEINNDPKWKALIRRAVEKITKAAIRNEMKRAAKYARVEW